MARARSAALALALSLGAALSACRAAAPAQVQWPDAPEALRDDSDRAAAIDRLWLAPPGPERERARAAIARAIAQRIDDAIDEDLTFAAAELLEDLTLLWQDDPDALGRGLATHAPLLRALRTLFARAGALEPAVRTLVVLAEADAPSREAHLAELDEVLEFADLLALAEHGPDGRRAQPLTLLQPTAVSLPLPWLVDRYVDLLVERQVEVAAILATRGATLSLVRAQTDILSASRRIAIVLARAGRADEIHAALQRLRPGIGATSEGRDRELRIAAELVAEKPTAGAYLELANRLRTDEHAPSPAGALAVGLAGLEHHPGDPELLSAAGGDARAIGRVDQAIALFEGALRAAPEVDPVIALRLGRLYGERITRLTGGGRPRAARGAWRDVMTFTAGVARGRPHTVWQQTTAIAESALGRGLASQGLVDEGRRALAASLERAPSIDALETLAIVDSQVDRFAAAQRWVAAGVALLGDDTTGDRYRRAKLERHSADALRRAGKRREAAMRYLDALRSWASLGETKDLPRSVIAERLLDSGRATWWLGDGDRAVELVHTAVEAGAELPEIATGAVAFLLEVGRYRDAVDAYHRCLGEPAVPELHKVYLSLWILGAAKRAGAPRDRQAYDYLGARRGDLWHERLARAATGRLQFLALRGAATTGPQLGEVAFYGAVLGLDPDAADPAVYRRLLEQVIAARVVFDAEYDLARAYLAGEPPAPVLAPPSPPPEEPAKPAEPAAPTAPAPRASSHVAPPAR